jgi:protein SCO1/2
VDPTHDTPRKLTEYLSNFDMRVTGLTGIDEQIAAVSKAYRIYYAPVSMNNQASISSAIRAFFA